jgi:hypothetical protein
VAELWAAALRLAHALAREVDAVGVVDEAIEDRIDRARDQLSASV